MWRISEYTDSMKKLSALFSALEPHSLLLAALLLLTVLRAPNFFEPYWYGDEAIYLTIGQALNRGSTLYTDIVDHKTPVIYYLARVDTQLNFRILLFAWMTASTCFLYILTQTFLNSPLARAVTIFSFVILTSIPWFEGMIPNGELFVIGFVLAGAALLTRTHYLDYLLSVKKNLQQKYSHQPLLLTVAGATFSAALLTKVPALFDIAAFASIGIFPVIDSIGKKSAVVLKNLLVSLRYWLFLGIGLALPLLASVLYFVLKDAGPDYLQFGLLYNFRYSQSWDLGFSSNTMNWIFSFQGKTILMLLGAGILLSVRNFVSIKTRWAALWLVFTLFASLLSNRPYPHYFMQVLPPLTLLVGLSVDAVLSSKIKRGTKVATLCVSTVGVGIFVWLLYVMNVGLYDTSKYYTDFLKYVSGKTTQQEYYQSFNYLMNDNYTAASVMLQDPNSSLYIWGTNPMLYALTQKPPQARFTVAFHIKDLQYYDETLDELSEAPPTYIVVMNEDASTFPELMGYVLDSYRVHSVYDSFTLWKRLPGRL